VRPLSNISMSFPLPKLDRRRDGDFEVGDILGRGNFTSVYDCTEIKTGRKFAVKIIDRYRCERLKKTADVHMEKHCLRRTNHPNIIKIHAFFMDCACINLVMEECDGGELWDMVKTVGLPSIFGRYYMGQMVNVIEYLRQARIVHRDLKAENIMINGAGTVKLIDFGTGKDFENPHVKGSGNASRNKVFEHYVGTPQFMPAEVIENKCSDNRSDTWSFGCLIFQVMAGAPPFHAASEYLVFLRIMDMDLQFPPGFDPHARDLIKKIVVKNADERLGAHDVNEWRRHPFFAGICFDNLHMQPQPMMSLGDLCLRHIGRNLKKLKHDIVAFGGLGRFQPDVRVVIERMQLVKKWLDDSMPQEAEDSGSEQDS